MARMYTNIEKADAVMGTLLDQLEDDQLADNTLICHWSDHGPLPRGKRWPYDSGIRVPLVIRWPRHVEPHARSDRLVSTIDLAPTMLSVAGLEVPPHLQGRAFLGPHEPPRRDYIFASRDRHDETYDMVRAARDRRFKYIRNYRPDLPRMLWVPYRNRHPIVQEMYRLHLAGELDETQELMFQTARLAEELYDTEADPFEIHNLARDGARNDDLQRLRDALDGWIDEVGDMGRIDEIEMVRRWYPDKVRPRTDTPLFVPIGETMPGERHVVEGGRFLGPILIQLCCSTQGASIAWTSESGEADEVHWNIYAGPLRLESGQTLHLRARAVRIGYHESHEAEATFICT